MPTRAPKHVPEGMHTVTPHLWFNGDCKQAIDFYQRAFGAELPHPVALSPDGESIMHAMMKVGNSHIMMADAWPGQWERGPKGGASMGLWLYVKDCDALFERAKAAGCEVVYPLMDAFWGDRTGKLKDPFGHCWAISTHQWVLTPEEMKKAEEEWLKTLSEGHSAC